MAVQRFFNADYFNDDYFDDEYFAQQSTNDVTGTIAATRSVAGVVAVAGDYYNPDYFNDDYFAPGYFALGGGSAGTVFVGSFLTANDFTGTIDVDTTKTSAFTGTVSQVLNFDLSVGFSVNWSFQEFTNVTGTIAASKTASSAITGLFSENYTGTIDVSTGANTANLDGTHTAPANRTGTIGTTTSETTALFQGVHVAPGGNTGTIAVSITKTSDFDGQYITSNTDGTLSATLNGVTATWVGSFIDAAANAGPLQATLNAATGSFLGSITAPEDVAAAIRMMDEPETRCTVDDPDLRSMRSA